MCRFALYLGPALTLDALLTRPVNSIVHQSFHSYLRREPLNGDGFGLAWYVPEISAEPALFRSITPAWNNQNLIHLARVTRSECVLAHVRAATPGLPVVETNCHPFVAGRLSFMHNGGIAGFSFVRRRMLDALSPEAFDLVQGSTDSEVVFAMFVDRYAASREEDGADRLASALEETVAAVLDFAAEAADHVAPLPAPDQATYLNVAVADGQRAAACRVTSGDPSQAATLFVHVGKRYVCEESTCRMLDPDEQGGAVLVCSEPLSTDPGWDAVPPNHLVVVRATHEVELRPLPI